MLSKHLDEFLDILYKNSDLKIFLKKKIFNSSRGVDIYHMCVNLCVYLFVFIYSLFLGDNEYSWTRALGSTNDI